MVHYPKEALVIKNCKIDKLLNVMTSYDVNLTPTETGKSAYKVHEK